MRKVSSLFCALVLMTFASPLLAAHDGIVKGTPTFGAAKFQNGMTASSGSNYGLLPSKIIAINGTSTWTIEMWLKTSASGTEVALGLGTSWIGEVGGNFTVNLTGGSLNSGKSINDGNWHDCAVVVTGGTSIATYVDGVAGATSGSTVSTITSTYTVGNLSGSFAWSGGVDELSFWKSAKYSSGYTPATSPYLGSESNLAALYHLQADFTDGIIYTVTPNSSPINVAYSYQMPAYFGVGPYTCTISAGSLPTGLSISSGCLITGTPTVLNSASATYEMTDSLGQVVDNPAVLSVYTPGIRGGTLTGTPTFGNAEFNSGPTILSNSNYISVPDGIISTSGTASWTIEGWATCPSAGTTVLYSMGNGVSFWVGSNPAGNLSFEFSSATGGLSGLNSSGLAICDGFWHHWAVVMSAGTTLSTYLDGVAGATFTGTYSPITGAATIGVLSPGGAYAWGGKIDEVAVWNYAKYITGFTPPAAPYTGDESGIAALYHLDGVALDSGQETAAGNGIAMSDPGIIYSPYTWNVSDLGAVTINSGAYFRTIFGGTSVALETNTVQNTYPFSQFWARIDGDSWQLFTFSAGQPTIVIGTGLEDRNHYLEVVVKATTQTLNRWTASQTQVYFTGILLDTGKVLIAPKARTKNILIYGDSITEGVRTVNNTASPDTGQNDVLSDYSYALSTAVDAEVGIVAFGSQGITAGGSGGVPALPSSYNYLYSGVARSFSPAPDLVIYNEGTNDGGSIVSGFETVVNGILTAAPTAKQLLLIPFDQVHLTDIQTVVTATANPLVTYQPTAGWFNPAYSSDGLHPYGYDHLGFIGPDLFPYVEMLLNGSSTSTIGVFTSF